MVVVVWQHCCYGAAGAAKLTLPLTCNTHQSSLPATVTMAMSKSTNTYNRQNWEDSVSKHGYGCSNCLLWWDGGSVMEFFSLLAFLPHLSPADYSAVVCYYRCSSCWFSLEGVAGIGEGYKIRINEVKVLVTGPVSPGWLP